MLKSQTMSRRGVLSLFGFGAALFAIPTTDAEAQTAGMERRQERRETRQNCRQANGLVGADKRHCKQNARQQGQPAQPAPGQTQ